MTVRYAEKNELERVNELRRIVNDVHVSGRPDIFREGFCRELEDHIYEAFDSETSDVIVALIDDRICGFATVQYIAVQQSPYKREYSYYRVEEFCVDEEYRRMGVATALIDFCRSEAKAKGFGRIEIDVWEFNEGALAFYEKVGFSTYRRFMEMSI